MTYDCVLTVLSKRSLVDLEELYRNYLVTKTRASPCEGRVKLSSNMNVKTLMIEYRRFSEYTLLVLFAFSTRNLPRSVDSAALIAWSA